MSEKQSIVTTSVYKIAVSHHACKM